MPPPRTTPPPPLQNKNTANITNYATNAVLQFQHCSSQNQQHNKAPTLYLNIFAAKQAYPPLQLQVVHALADVCHVFVVLQELAGIAPADGFLPHSSFFRSFVRSSCMMYRNNTAYEKRDQLAGTMRPQPTPVVVLHIRRNQNRKWAFV